MNIVAWSLLFIGVAGLLWSTIKLKSSDDITTIPPASLDINTSEAPSAIKPSPGEIQEYVVPPDMPKYINIPKLSIDKARTIHLGADNDGKIASPDNLFDSGWYNSSSKPGQPGAMFIYAHVSSWEADGLFHDLDELGPGDEIVVTRGDDETFTYKVDSSKIYDYKSVDMDAVLSPVNASKPSLNLMTCAGSIIEGSNDFSQRLVVFTSLVNS